MKELYYTTFEKKPPLLVKEYMNYQMFFIINIEQKKIINDIGVEVWEQCPISLDTDTLEYENIIAAIVNARYSSDDVTAITLNHLLTMHNEAEEDKKDEYVSEYNALQEWRKKAKEIAKEVLSYWEAQKIPYNK